MEKLMDHRGGGAKQASGRQRPGMFHSGSCRLALIEII